VTVPILGRSKDEWDILSRWIVNNDLVSPQFRWLISIRLNYKELRINDEVTNFEQYLRNIFEPLFEVLDNPESHPELSQVISNISGFTTTNYEGKNEYKVYPNPTDWSNEENPPYFYYMFYIWSNMNSLNSYRERKGLRKFLLRPISGFTGSLSELEVAFLLTDSVCHGNQLKNSAILQYLFYLEQVGISMAILKEDAVIVNYKDHPFNKFLKRGLNVTIATASPLQIHFTNDPLAEEYAIASQFWKLGPPDIAEIARNSVLISGFDHETKKKAIGDLYDQGFNDPSKTSIPQIRFDYRKTSLDNEIYLINQIAL